MELLRQKVEKHWLSLLIAGLLLLMFALFFLGKDKYLMGLILLGPALIIGEMALFRKHNLFLISLFLIPFSSRIEVIGDAAMSLPGELFVLIFAAYFLYQSATNAYAVKKVLLHPLSILLIMDLLWFIYATAFSTMPIVSLKRAVMRMLFIVVFFYFSTHWMSKLSNVPKLMLAYTSGLIFVIAMIMKAHAHYAFSTRVSFSISEPWYDDHTIYGACIAFLIPLIAILYFKAADFGFSKTLKHIFGAIAIFLVIGVILSYSRAAILSLGAALGFYMLLRLRVKFGTLILLTGLAAIFAYGLSSQILEHAETNEVRSNEGGLDSQLKSVTNMSTDASNLERINRWVCALRMFNDRPLTGFGPGTYQFEYGAFQTSYDLTYISTFRGDKGNAHSEYLTYLAETGIFGFLNFLLIVGYTVFLGMRLYYRSKNPVVQYLALGALLGLITFWFHGIFNSFIDQEKMASLAFGSMAMLVALDVFHNKKTVVE